MKKNSGLTLMELIISISFLGLVVVSAVAINASANRFLTSQNNQAIIASQASTVVELIVKDIKLSFGDPANEAFRIFLPGAVTGNMMKLRRFDVAPSGPDINDKWVAYRYDANNHILEYNNDAYGAGVYVTIARNVVAINRIFEALDVDGDGNALNDNVISVEITCRQDPTQPASPLNTQVTLTTVVRIPSISS